MVLHFEWITLMMTFGMGTLGPQVERSIIFPQVCQIFDIPYWKTKPWPQPPGLLSVYLIEARVIWKKEPQLRTHLPQIACRKSVGYFSD